MFPIKFSICFFLLLVENSLCEHCTWEFQVRLDSPGYAGRLEICANTQSHFLEWKTICSSTNDQVGDIVTAWACGNRGYDYEGMSYTTRLFGAC